MVPKPHSLQNGYRDYSVGVLLGPRPNNAPTELISTHFVVSEACKTLPGVTCWTCGCQSMCLRPHFSGSRMWMKGRSFVFGIFTAVMGYEPIQELMTLLC